MLIVHILVWLVVSTHPSEKYIKIWVRQLGLWHSQYMEKMVQTTNQWCDDWFNRLPFGPFSSGSSLEGHHLFLWICVRLWLLGGWPTNPSEKWWTEFVSWGDEIPNLMGKIVQMFQTTNQFILVMIGLKVANLMVIGNSEWWNWLWHTTDNDE